MMRISKFILTTLIFYVIIPVYGQKEISRLKSENYQALAKLISFDGGNKVQFAKFKILKNLSNSSFLSDTITVGYYNYKEPVNIADFVLLHLNKYDGQTTMNNYFICPNYDGKIGIQSAKIEFIDFDYWEGCEAGKQDCKPLTFTRMENQKNWFLIMPCGGTETDVKISGKNFSQDMRFQPGNCPPMLELTNMLDGKYFANMTSCNLGGTVTINLKTK